MKILWNFACRHRKEKLFAAVENIIENATIEDYVILLKIDLDDAVLCSKPVWERLKSYGKRVIVAYGYSKGKIDAINRDIMLAGDFDILCNHSDDMVILRPAFDRRIIHEYLKLNDLSYALHIPDGYANERLITYSIMGKKLYDAFGYVYHPKYFSLYADNEYHESVVELGKYKFVNEAWYKHEHASNTGHGADDLLKFTESFYPVDGETYRKRRTTKFDIERVRLSL